MVGRGARVLHVALLLAGIAAVALIVLWAAYGFASPLSPDPAVESAFDWGRVSGRGGLVDAAMGAARRVHALNRRMKEQLAALPHVTVYTPMSDTLSAGIVGFDVRGLKPADVVERLRRQRIIASESPYGRSMVRLSAGIMNSPEDIDVAVRAVDGLRSEGA